MVSEKRKKRNRSYRIYIKRIAKKQDQNIFVRKNALCIIDQIATDIINRATTEASSMSKKTLGIKMIAPALRTIIKDKELQKEMEQYALIAVSKFLKSNKK